MGVETEIQIKIKTANPFEARAKMEHIKFLSSLDTDILEKLVKLGKNNNAIQQLKNNFSMIESFLG
ncbi:hypothetical protein [Flavobacterium sp.]|uniref:hypothetical protein n=1 Tax=Flavobacterium sp. TaxID=239 RepID=UPI00374CAF00